MANRIKKVAAGDATKPFGIRSLSIGNGVISTAPEALVQTAIEVPPNKSPDWIVTPHDSVRASIALVSERDTLIRQLETDSGGSWMYSGIQFGFDSGYTKVIRTSTYSLTFAISIVVISGFKRIKEYKLTSEAKALFDKSPTQFAESYGDLYCGEQVFGGTLCAIGTYATGSRRQHEDISASIEANAMFGAWSDARLKSKQISTKEKFDITVYTEGAFRELPKSKHLASPDKFLTLCDEWIRLARANTTRPVQSHFGRYRSIPYIGSKGIEANVAALRGLTSARDDALDTMESIRLIRNNRENYERFPEEDLRKATESTREFIADGNERIAAVQQEPFGNIEVPIFSKPPLPQLSKYSIDAIFSHLLGNGYVEVVLSEAVNLPKGTIEANKKYKVFWKMVSPKNPRWYCRAPDGSYTPTDVTTKKGCTRGWLYMWGQLFSYDNHGTLVHYTLPVSGKVELVSEF